MFPNRESIIKYQLIKHGRHLYYFMFFVFDKWAWASIIFDDQLKWEPHINKTCCKVYCSLSRLWKIALAMPLVTRLPLVKTLIIQIITYGYPVFRNITERLNDKLQLVVYACTRFVLGIRKYNRLCLNKKGLKNLTISIRDQIFIDLFERERLYLIIVDFCNMKCLILIIFFFKIAYLLNLEI